MAPTAPRFFRTPAVFRRWLETNHGRRSELFVGFHKKASGKPSIGYAEALDEALCFGWIDGLKIAVNETSYAIRFTPRGPRSIWSTINTKRVAELTKAGRMAPAGLAAYAKRDRARTGVYSSENRAVALSPSYAKRLAADAKARAFFDAQPPGARSRRSRAHQSGAADLSASLHRRPTLRSNSSTRSNSARAS